MLDLIEEVKLEWSEMEIEVLEKDIKKMSCGLWEQERVVYEKMRARLSDLKDMRLSEKYKPISLDFMSAHTAVPDEEFGFLHVPKFCPFTRTRNTFSVSLYMRRRHSAWSTAIAFNDPRHWLTQASDPGWQRREETLPQVVNHPLVEAVNSRPRMGWYKRAKGFDRGFEAKATASLSFLIPAEAKRKMMDATGFDHKYIVAEVPKEAWQVTVLPIDKDPLIIGIKGKHAFLITAFDPTPLESYVMKEFLKE